MCSVCHGWVDPQYPWCWNCRTSIKGVQYPERLVVPITLYKSRSQLGSAMGQYKRNRDARVRAGFSVQLAALVARFLADHGSCIEATAGTTWDTITVVPSTKGDPDAPGHLEQSLQRVQFLADQFKRLVRSTGQAVPRDEPNELAFEANVLSAGRKVLLVDDTLTTGGHLQSVASALVRGGATVVACLVVGRVINPDYRAETKAFWERQLKIPFDFDTCCLEESA